MLYCFLNDSALYDTTTPQLDTGNIGSSAGYASDYIRNFFVKQSIIRDDRLNRIDSVFNAGSKHTLVGNMTLCYDGEQNPTLVVDNVTRNALFNIIEMCLYSGSSTDSLNTLMSSNSDYTIYRENTLTISTTSVNLSNVHTTTGDVSGSVRDWISFNALINGEIIGIKVWCGSNNFVKNYPISNITKVIFPCDPNKLLNLDYSNIYTMLVASSEYMNNQIAEEVCVEDHTGMYSYSTTYQNSSSITKYSLPFGLFYKGAEPSSQQCRDTIANALLELGLATQDEWKEIFPDLYTGATFFLVPIYDNTTALPGKIVNCGIIDILKVTTKLKTLYPNETEALNNAEIITCDASQIFIGVISSSANSTEYQSLKRVHPTYQRMDATNPNFSQQSIYTQQFNKLLCDTITYVEGNTTEIPTGCNKNIINGIEYVSFVVNTIEYNVLTKTNYPV